MNSGCGKAQWRRGGTQPALGRNRLQEGHRPENRPLSCKPSPRGAGTTTPGQMECGFSREPETGSCPGGEPTPLRAAANLRLTTKSKPQLKTARANRNSA